MRKFLSFAVVVIVSISIGLLIGTFNSNPNVKIAAIGGVNTAAADKASDKTEASSDKADKADKADASDEYDDEKPVFLSVREPKALPSFVQDLYDDEAPSFVVKAVAVASSDDDDDEKPVFVQKAGAATGAKAAEAASAQDANARFINNVKVQMLGSKDKKRIGDIYEGSPVKLIKEEGDLALVEIEGEVVADDDSALAHRAAPLVRFLQLEEGKAQPKMSFYVKAADLTTDAKAAWEDVDLYYYDTCTSCHSAHKPGEHAMDEWDAYISSMQLNAKINDEQKERILRFMEAHAKDGPFGKKK